MKDRVEILAPAGSMECLKAAIAAGADAVYTGGALFGARAYAHNLTEEELLEAIDYVHLHGRRLYLTVNTLIKDREMEKQMYDLSAPLVLPAGAGCGDRAGYRTVPFYPEAFSRSSDPRKYPDDAYGSGWGEVSGKGRCTADCYIQRTEYGRGEEDCR